MARWIFSESRAPSSSTSFMFFQTRTVATLSRAVKVTCSVLPLLVCAVQAVLPCAGCATTQP